LGVILLLFSLVPSLVIAHEIQGTVVGIADGDTITVLDSNKQQHKIRLYGIDCPEGGQAYGNKAKKAVSGLVYGKSVTVHVLDRDRYGRDVGMVVRGGVNINAELVAHGYAWVFTKYCKVEMCNDWYKLQEQAEIKKLGLWADPNPITPWDYRSQQRSGQADIASGATVYHGNVKSKVFHHPGCRHFNCKNCTRVFKSREEAIAAGYRPCGGCKP
jgi:micrococcal nuclease